MFFDTCCSESKCQESSQSLLYRVVECLYFTLCFVHVLHVVFGASRCILNFPLCFVLQVLFCTSRSVMHSEGNIKVSSTVQILYYYKQEFVIIKSKVSHLVLYILKNINIVRMFLSLSFVYMILVYKSRSVRVSEANTLTRLTSFPEDLSYILTFMYYVY